MEIERSYDLPFPVTRVFDAWVSSETVIAPATAMDIQPELGGHYRLIMETPEFTGRNEGVFKQFEPGSRVCSTWEWNGDGEVTEVDVRFAAQGTGTRVQICHRGFTDQASCDQHQAGWDGYIEGFKAFLAAAS